MSDPVDGGVGGDVRALVAAADVGAGEDEVGYRVSSVSLIVRAGSSSPVVSPG